MTDEEIAAMFQANAALKNCHDNTNRLQIENALCQLKKQYLSQIVFDKPKELSIQDAFNVLVQACESAMTLEFAYHPNGISDEQLHSLAAKRKKSLEIVASCLMEKS